MAITADEEVLSGQPRLDGTRISVLQVYDTVVGGDTPPAEAAVALDLSLGEIHEALAYYYNHPDEMAHFRAAQKRARDDLAARVVKPPVETEDGG